MLDAYIHPDPGAASSAAPPSPRQASCPSLVAADYPSKHAKEGDGILQWHCMDRDRRGSPFRQMTTVPPLPVPPRILEHFLEQ